MHWISSQSPFTFSLLPAPLFYIRLLPQPSFQPSHPWPCRRRILASSLPHSLHSAAGDGFPCPLPPPLSYKSTLPPSRPFPARSISMAPPSEQAPVRRWSIQTANCTQNGRHVLLTKRNYNEQTGHPDIQNLPSANWAGSSSWLCWCTTVPALFAFLCCRR